LAGRAGASVVIVDFNDNNPGQLVGQAGGQGLSGTWASSTNPQVVAGDLTAPASTHYAVAQSSGTAQSLQTTASTGSTNTNGQASRGTAVTLTGTVWFSFLADAIDANARVGMSFNASGAGASGSRIDLVGTGLFVSYGAGQTLTNAQSTGATHLYVGEVVINESGTNDHLRLWLDPDVNTLTESTTAGKVFEGSTANWVGDGITSIAVQTYGASTPGGILDAVRVSDGPTAFTDVTGATPVPEPAACAGLLGAAGALGLRRRGRRA
jgi:hypothetical protein